MAARLAEPDYHQQLAELDAKRQRLASTLVDLPWSGNARKVREQELAAIDAQKAEVWALIRRQRLLKVLGRPTPPDITSSRPPVPPRALRLRAPRRDWRTMLQEDMQG